MKTQRTTFLAGVAALALIAGTSIATAQQDTSQEHKGAMQPRGSTPMKSNQGAGAVGQSTQTGKTGETERTGGARGGTPGQNVQEGKMSQTEGTAKSETQKGKAADRMNQSASEKGTGANAKEPNPRAQQLDRAHKTNTDQFGEDKTKKGTMDEDRAAQDGRAGAGTSTSEQSGRAARIPHNRGMSASRAYRVMPPALSSTTSSALGSGTPSSTRVEPQKRPLAGRAGADHAVELPGGDPGVEAGSALTYGNTVVLKLAQDSPLTGLHIARGARGSRASRRRAQRRDRPRQRGRGAAR